MCPEDLLLLVTSIAVIIAKEQPSELVAVYAALFTTLGDALATYVTQSEFLDQCCNKDTTTDVC